MRKPVFMASILIASTNFGQPGSLDPTYGEQGIELLASGFGFHRAQDVMALADNTSLVCGVATNGGQQSAVVIHLLNDGTLDTAFGESGYAWVMEGLGSWANGIALLDGGSILVGGWIHVEDFNTASAYVAKFHPNGLLDTAFGEGGLSIFLINGAPAFLYDLVVDATSRIVGCGAARDANGSNNGLLVRLNADGTLDTTFSGDGTLVNTAFPAGTQDDVLEDVTMLPDGSILAAGGGLTGDGNLWSILFKTGTDGTPDVAFGDNGVVVPALGSMNDYAYGLIANADGILICGYLENEPSAHDAMVAKLHGDGSLDTLFGIAGVAVVNDSAWNEGAMDMALQADGKLVVTGFSGEYGDFGYGDAVVWRLNADGTFDTGFGEAGIVHTDVQPSFDGGLALALQPDGRILVAGRLATFDNVNRMFVARYLSNSCAVFPSVSPESLILCPNGITELTTGTFDTYQWYKNGTLIPGANSQTLPVTTTDAGSWFKVETSIDTCSAISDSVLVDGYVFLLPYIINEGDQPNGTGDDGEQIYCDGDNPQLVIGSPYDTNIQWFNFGTPISGANNTVLAPTSSGSYSVEGAPAVCPDFVMNAGVSVTMDFHPIVQPVVVESGILLCPDSEGVSAQWFYNGQPFFGGIGQCCIPIFAGEYTVFVDYGDSCSVLSQPFVLVGIREHDGTRFQAAPLPTSDRVTITWTTGKPIPNWRLLDITGRQVLSGAQTNSPLELDLGKLEVGRYWFLSNGSQAVPMEVVR